VPVSTVTADPTTLTLTAVAEYPVPVERLWAAWADPRKLERFWGPPTWPATFTRHDMVVGGESAYSMSGPNGEVTRGWWRFVSVDPGRSFEVDDGFAGEHGEPNPDLPVTRMVVQFEATGAGSRFVMVSRFPTIQAMESLLEMGMVQGLTLALAQMDEVLADLAASFVTATLEVVDDTHVVIRREVRGSLLQVWRAFHEPALIQRWMLGPDGWTMPVCEVATEVGGTYRYLWESAESGQRFGFTGELLAHDPPRHSRTTENMIGMEGPGTVNDLYLTPRPGGRVRIDTHITYPSKDLRDFILGTGLIDGLETSYARLESQVLPAEVAA
jgi:uncharacterized protein YndB with AHSA1/START domain